MRDIRFFMIFLVSFLACCNESSSKKTETDSIYASKDESLKIDQITLGFFTNEIFKESMKGKNAVYFLYPDFCGACNDSVISFIMSNKLREFKNHFVFSGNDSVLVSRFYDLSGEIFTYEPEYLMQFGLYKASNHLYLFKDSLLLYESSINSENLEQVAKESSIF